MNIQLQITELCKQKLGSSFNVLLEQLLFLWLQFRCQQFDVPLHIGNKLLLVKRRLLLWITWHNKFSHQDKDLYPWSYQKANTITNLQPECVNNINDLDSLVINTFIFSSTFSRRVCTNVYINCSLNNPLKNPNNVLM